MADRSQLSKVLVAVLAVCVVLGVVFCARWEARVADAPPLLTATAHGWRSARVIATRYRNPTIGYNIGFLFPRDPMNSDAVEVSQFMHVHEGLVLQSGGAPDAEMVVQFRDVTDRPSADRKLQAVLPLLDRLMEDMAREDRIFREVNRGR